MYDDTTALVDPTDAVAMTTGDSFYRQLDTVADFAALAARDAYSTLPDDWVVGTADIVNSTGEIAQGRYKTVNMVGAAVIAALSNALNTRAFPFVFGGDGASFAVPGSQADVVQNVLSSLRRWAAAEFAITLRAALVPVADIRAAGHDVRVARYQPSPGVDYAMFSGGGLAWAEARMKAGAHAVPDQPQAPDPDLTGLSCRWSNARSRNGRILSLVVEPAETAPDEVLTDLATRIDALCQGLDRGGHPLPDTGPPIRWPPPGLTLDAHVSRRGRNLRLHQLGLLGQNLLIWLLFRFRIRLGSFEPAHYARTVTRNADFRKIDDGFKMTLDCDPGTQARIEALLDTAWQAGQIRYGLHEQDEAMITCFVPSAVDDDHMHFVDGAAGGYTRAAARMRD